MRTQWAILSICSIVVGGFLVGAIPAFAQSSEETASAMLVSDPPYPSPYSRVVVSLEAYTMNTSGANIQWFVNGSEISESRNSRSVAFTTGSVGQVQKVTAKITLQNNLNLNLSYNVVPSSVDLVIESNAYTPAFYKGRALPGGNSSVRVVAIPHFIPSVPLSALSFEWKQGETVLFGGPITGKYAADVLVSPYEDDYITVRVSDLKGNALGGNAIFLTPSDPELHFYEDNPLRGLSERALSDSFHLIGDETTIHAEPFFMATNLAPTTATFEWLINGREEFPGGDPHRITLRRTGGQGSAQVEVTALTTATMPQYTKNSLQVTF